MRCTDAHCLAEYAYGASADWTTYLEVQLDEGIGLSVFRDGDCLTGSTDIFGEIGHTIYHPDGDICKCGNRGCLETIAGISSIERKFIRAQSVVASSVDGKELSEITLNDIVSLSTDGSKTARLALKEAAAAVGNTLANVVNVLGIVDIVLYGPLTVARSILESEVTEALRSRCVFPLNQFVRVHFSELDRYATASGAAWESLRRWYNESRVSSSG
jgi:transcriptional regulator of PTS gene